MKKHIIAIAVAGTLLNTAALANSHDDIETLVISGARTPIAQTRLAGSVTLISQQQIEQSKAINLAELLRGLPGIALSQSGTRGTLHELRMRGSESNHVLVLVDGVAINDYSQSDGVNLSHINLNEVARIEVLRGAQSALWGSGAIGGVINIVTKQGSKHLQASGSAEVGEASSYQVAANLQHRLDQVGYALGVSKEYTQGDNIALQGNEKDGYRNLTTNGKVNWQINQNNALQLTARYLKANNEFDNFIPADANNHSEVAQYSGQLLWQLAGNNWQQQLGWQVNDHDNKNFQLGAFASRTSANTQKLFWQGSWFYSGDNQLTLALEQLEQDFDQVFSGKENVQNNKVRSVVLDGTHQLVDGLDINASLRYDDNQDYDSASSYQFGVSYRPYDKLKLYASYAKAVKNPTFTETFGFFPESFIGNPNLTPEHSKGWELGADWQISHHWQLAVSGFDNTLQDEIKPVFYPDYTSTSINSQHDSKRRGLELSLTGSIASSQVNLYYSYLDSSEADFTGQQQREQRRPRNTGGLIVSYRFADEKAQVRMQASYQGGQKDTDFSTYTPVQLGGYSLIDLALSYQLTHHWQVYLRANNLFDKNYTEVVNYNSPSRKLALGSKVTF